MGRSGRGIRTQLRAHVGAFFTNWATYDAPLWRKLGLTVRNRVSAVVMLRGCCGNHGQPGC